MIIPLLTVVVSYNLLLQITCLSSPPQTTQLCRSEEKTALLEFMSHFSFHKGQSYCLNPNRYPWKTNDDDCCDWYAVECSRETGHIIGLFLEHHCLHGNILMNSSLFSLVHLKELYLNGNNFNNSPISPLLANLRNLESLRLKESNLSGAVPNEIFQLPKLKGLDLSGNSKLTGKIPRIINATQLEHIDLSGTGFTGELPDTIGELKSLSELNLARCRFSGSIPDSIGKLTKLDILNVAHNNFSGTIPSSISNLWLLRVLDISYNNLEGSVLHSIFNLTKYYHLDLSRNYFNDTIDYKIFKEFDMLAYLDLSYSGLSLTSTDENSSFLFHFSGIGVLGLSSCNLSTIILKDLNAQNTLSYLDLSNNNIREELHSSICNLTSLIYLDLSHNQFSGLIPTCLGNITELYTLNFQRNSFYGKIPESFGYAKNLQLLDLSNNLLEGNLPRSLANCSTLEVLNLGINLLTGGFPFWLGYLSSLKVLILRENKISGTITWEAKNKQDNFSNLHIIDISQNDLSGTLPSKYFESWKSMMTVDEDASTYASIRNFWTSFSNLSPPSSFYYSLNITNKGLLLPYKKILTALKVVDFSCNKFHGNIPSSVGGLRGIQVLNFSRNAFTGPVPWFLGNLTNLESLDLSDNMFSGEIPKELSTLNYLEVLDLSQNNLTGVIPSYLDKFPNASYDENPGLCGLPLSKLCNNPNTPISAPPSFAAQKTHHFKFELNDFGWEVVAIGYGCGFVIGVVIGSFISVSQKGWIARVFNL